MKHQDDGKFVVVNGTERVSGLKDSLPDAQAEAQKQRTLEEAKGPEGKKVAENITIKKNLLG